MPRRKKEHPEAPEAGSNEELSPEQITREQSASKKKAASTEKTVQKAEPKTDKRKENKKVNPTDPRKKKEMQGHRERIRERFLEDGLDGFNEDYEVLELLLQFAIPYRDTKSEAKQLLAHFGSLTNVLDASYEDLLKADIPRVRETAAILITLIKQMQNRYHKTKGKEQVYIRSTADAGRVCTSMFYNQADESVRIVCLNARGKIVKRDEIAKGDVNAVHFPVRKIVETAIASKAVSVILTHNHPGGTLAPSREDVDATEAAKAALDTIGVRLLDHLIVCGDDYCSLREEGYF